MEEGAMQGCGTVANMWTKETACARPSNPTIGLAVPPPGSQHVERREHEPKNDAHQRMVQANQLRRLPFGCDWRMAGSQKEP